MSRTNTLCLTQPLRCSRVPCTPDCGGADDRSKALPQDCRRCGRGDEHRRRLHCPARSGSPRGLRRWSPHQGHRHPLPRRHRRERHRQGDATGKTRGSGKSGARPATPGAHGQDGCRRAGTHDQWLLVVRGRTRPGESHRSSTERRTREVGLQHIPIASSRWPRWRCSIRISRRSSSKTA